MPAQEPLPRLVSEHLREVRGADDVGEHEGLRGAQGPGPTVLGVAELALGDLDIDARAEPPELVERRAKLELGVVVVAHGAERSRQHGSRSSDFVGRPDLAPALDRAAQLA